MYLRDAPYFGITPWELERACETDALARAYVNRYRQIRQIERETAGARERDARDAVNRRRLESEGWEFSGD